jgi:hypothetical protein
MVTANGYCITTEAGIRTKNCPQACQRKRNYPPGLRKYIEKDGHLPPGIEGRRLPDVLERTLQRLPTGYVRLQVGGDVILMNEKSRYVLDIFWEVD